MKLFKMLSHFTMMLVSTTMDMNMDSTLSTPQILTREPWGHCYKKTELWQWSKSSFVTEQQRRLSHWLSLIIKTLLWNWRTPLRDSVVSIHLVQSRYIHSVNHIDPFSIILLVRICLSFIQITFTTTHGSISKQRRLIVPLKNYARTNIMTMELWLPESTLQVCQPGKMRRSGSMSSSPKVLICSSPGCWKKILEFNILMSKR